MIDAIENININKIRNGLIRFSSFDKNLIDSLSFQLASYSLNDSLWITKRDFFNQVDFINYENEKKYHIIFHRISINFTQRMLVYIS